MGYYLLTTMLLEIIGNQQAEQVLEKMMNQEHQEQAQVRKQSRERGEARLQCFETWIAFWTPLLSSAYAGFSVLLGKTPSFVCIIDGHSHSLFDDLPKHFFKVNRKVRKLPDDCSGCSGQLLLVVAYQLHVRLVRLTVGMPGCPRCPFRGKGSQLGATGGPPGEELRLVAT